MDVDLLEKICADMRGAPDLGKVADYIPELAKVDPRHFGISVCLADGRQLSAGDADVEFSVQSVSKVFTLSIALGRFGERLWQRVGREPSTNAFNSVHELEVHDGIPPNPFVNSGAIVTTDALLVGARPRETLAEILHFVRYAASDDDIHIDAAVARSEKLTGDKNWALAHMLRAYRNLDNACALALGTYFHQCAIRMSCEQLARFGRFLAHIHPHRSPVRAEHVRNINALMLTCGHYDGSGEFAFRVGMPAKSGVGGGILAVVPGIASVAVWSPGLNKHGNSLRGTAALEELSTACRWSVFEPHDR
ncbi:glutaminase [Chachezhania sediminis]|uniref:glutaminase n=1 Tax=Chachezhania sediminis TaxID=2599291 RepID=UPI00131CAEA4|nr:glutaminase [Chachezhania sediminis]